MYTPKNIYINVCIYTVEEPWRKKKKHSKNIYHRGNKEEIMKGRKMYLLPAITNAPYTLTYTHTFVTDIISHFLLPYFLPFYA